MLKQYFTPQFLKFLLVGVTAAFLHWLARIGLSFWFPFYLSVAFAYMVGIMVAFILNTAWVFPESDRPRQSQLKEFIFVNLAFFPIVWILAIGLKAFLERIGTIPYTEAIAHGIAVAFPALATFLIYKFSTFRSVNQN